MEITGSNPVGGTSIPLAGPILEPFAADHVAAASSLVAARVSALRAAVPELPGAWTDETAIGRVVATLAERGSGVAAIRDGRLAGFQTAMLLDGHGGRWAWTPDVGHALAAGEDARLVETIYASAAESWVRQGCAEHVVTLLGDDGDGAAAFAELGFGRHVVDLVRDLRPVTVRGVDGIEVRRAVPGDAVAVMQLDLELRRHLSASPVFLGLGAQRSLEVHRRMLADPAGATFVASTDDGDVVAFLRIGPCADDAAVLVRDAGTASITEACTRPDLRGQGIATALLAAAVAWARVEGYVRCTAGHESANRAAARFWARHLTPVALSMSRRLPSRVVA